MGFFGSLLEYLANILSYFCKGFFLFIFRQRGREEEKEGEKHLCGCFLCVTYWGPAWQPRQACVLTGNGTGNALVYRRRSIYWATLARLCYFLGCLFISLIVPLAVHKIFGLIQPTGLFLLLLSVLLVSYLRNHGQHQCQGAFFLCFLLKF